MPRLTSQTDKKSLRILLTCSIFPQLSLMQPLKTETTVATYCTNKK